jgi:hypothetical protein
MDGPDLCGPPTERGSVRAQVTLPNGKPLSAFHAFVSRQRPGWHHFHECDGPSSDFTVGQLSFDALPPGIYTLSLSADGFISPSIDPFAVRVGHKTDLGKLTMDPGRTLRGRVLDVNRRPVANAIVLSGDSLWGDEKSLLTLSERTTITAADGTYSLAGLGRGPVFVIADAPPLGRSMPARLSPGNAPLTASLLLVPTGELGGAVTYDGKPAKADITAEPVSGLPSVRFSASTDGQGKYAFRRLAEGDYRVTAQLIVGEVHALVFPTKVLRATVSSKQLASLDLEIPKGAKLLIHTGLSSGKGDMISVALLKGTHAPKSDADLRAILDAADPDAVRETHTHVAQKQDLEILDVVPGAYSLCGEVSRYEDPQSQMKSLPVTCTTVVVGPTARQDVSFLLGGR